MSHPIARSLGALALAAALATSSSVALAAARPDSPVFYLTKKVTTTGGLSLALRTSAVEKARSLPTGPRLKGEVGTSKGHTDDDLDAICGKDDWFITWEEDANGNPITGTFQLHCADFSVPIG